MTLYTYQFDFPPVHKLREKIGKRGGFYTLVPNEKTEAFESDVARIARFTHRKYGAPIEGRLNVDILLEVSHKRGDVDNYAKAILDGLQKAEVFKNDNAIDILHVARNFVAKGKENFSVLITVVQESK